ncbi:Cytochrome c oxidase assembly protein PET191 [Nesidiocoris tenuis]|uniref:Cytochrome c oxidase assembly factor 5 n=1 Tax=Nesidiocoris tenuis TaxID=355587 RepID=A0ABN7ARF4_9HEMI|nr:Cytochrome c oxidase assembly protein PET191 [Nesidiocoris tenuis]
MLSSNIFHLTHTFSLSPLTMTNFSQKMQDKGLKLDGQGNVLVDGSTCAGVRADLKTCLLESDCVKKDKKTPRECLRINDATVPAQCQVLRNLFFECKRSMLDNRTRFRGTKGY